MKIARLAITPDCDVHRYVKHVSGVPARYDGPTRLGTHGYMCQECFDEVGIPGSSINRRLERPVEDDERFVPPGEVTERTGEAIHRPGGGAYDA